MKYVFVDMDGVIAEYGYPSGLYDGEFQRGNYSGKRPVGIVIEEIVKRYNKEGFILMVCSASPNTKATMEKNEWLDIFFKVPYENRIFIGLEEDKVEAIRYYIEDIMRGNIQENTIIIDDKGKVLAKAHSLGIECYHPTQILSTIQQTVEEQTNQLNEDSEADIIDSVSDVLEGQMTIDDIPTA